MTKIAINQFFDVLKINKLEKQKRNYRIDNKGLKQTDGLQRQIQYKKD